MYEPTKKSRLEPQLEQEEFKKRTGELTLDVPKGFSSFYKSKNPADLNSKYTLQIYHAVSKLKQVYKEFITTTDGIKSKRIAPKGLSAFVDNLN